MRAETEENLDSPALWMPVSVMAQADGHLSVFPHILLDRAKPGLLAVDKTGRRFVNEANSYHDFVEAMLRSNRLESGVPSFLICDRSFIADYGIGLIHPGTRILDRYLSAAICSRATWSWRSPKRSASTAPSFPKRSSVTTAMRNGNDEEFGRGTSELNRFNGDPDNKPNPCLRKLGPGPWFAVAVWPADLASSAGLRTDARDACCRRGGNPLKGLYAAGNDAASIFRGTYPGPGTMLGPALVFGWCAAMDVAGRLDGYLVNGERTAASELIR